MSETNFALLTLSSITGPITAIEAANQGAEALSLAPTGIASAAPSAAISLAFLATSLICIVGINAAFAKKPAPPKTKRNSPRDRCEF
jgi:hypothetical protein